ncbi:MAG: hypothetical protein H7Z16_05570 [Pyrinomonadaceae bacterium]|nr:hypothetical protein [Pyrinomonadaceae bacterium]
MDFVLIVRRASRFVRGAGLLAGSLCFLCTMASGQSADITAPVAVRTSEVTGSIAARDLGDSRLTDHFFVFTGTPGDLLITVESRNLNGDVDVFTLAGMRPLLKFTVYEGSAPVTVKSIYLRKREDLILRIEARTPNDDEGTYRVKFGGSFEPIIGGPEGGPLSAAAGTPSVDEAATGAKSGKRGSRVSSVGARIYEPPSAEVAAAPTPEPEPVPKPARVTTPRASSRSARGRRPATSRTRPATEEKPATEKPATEIPIEPEVAATAPKETEPKPTTGRRRPGRRSATARAVEKPASPAEPESGPRLIIETSDGTLINRYMTSVRRVTVENGQVVVVGKDGKVERFLLANVVRMSVGP